jgi:N-acetylmuramoyl-L-alanine amidase
VAPRRTLVLLVAAGFLLGAGNGAAAPGRAIDPQLFQPGSCVAFDPIFGHRDRTVFIDAGHGGPDPGGVGTTAAGRTIGEAPLNVAVALDALTLLRRHGFRVVLSRTGSAAVGRPLPGDLAGGVFTPQGSHRDLVARDRCADLAHASIVIGMDFDAAATPDAAGSVTLYDAVRPYAPSSLRLARLVQGDVLARLRRIGAPVPDLGVHTDVGFGSALTQADRDYGHLLLLGPAKPGYLDTPTMAPAALIEPLFLTDSAEASLAASARGQHAIARGLATAAEQYFGVRVGVATRRLPTSSAAAGRSRARRRGA